MLNIWSHKLCNTNHQDKKIEYERWDDGRQKWEEKSLRMEKYQKIERREERQKTEERDEMGSL